MLIQTEAIIQLVEIIYKIGVVAHLCFTKNGFFDYMVFIKTGKSEF
jgi:hypothetical protein